MLGLGMRAEVASKFLGQLRREAQKKIEKASGKVGAGRGPAMKKRNGLRRGRRAIEHAQNVADRQERGRCAGVGERLSRGSRKLFCVKGREVVSVIGSGGGERQEKS